MGGAADLWWDGAVARGWQFWFGRALTSDGPVFTEIVGLFGSPVDERDRTRIARFESAVAWDPVTLVTVISGPSNVRVVTACMGTMEAIQSAF